MREITGATLSVRREKIPSPDDCECSVIKRAISVHEIYDGRSKSFELEHGQILILLSSVVEFCRCTQKYTFMLYACVIFVSELTYDVSSGTLNPTQSLTHTCETFCLWVIHAALFKCGVGIQCYYVLEFQMNSSEDIN